MMSPIRTHRAPSLALLLLAGALAAALAHLPSRAAAQAALIDGLGGPDGFGDACDPDAPTNNGATNNGAATNNGFAPDDPAPAFSGTVEGSAVACAVAALPSGAPRAPLALVLGLLGLAVMWRRRR